MPWWGYVDLSLKRIGIESTAHGYDHFFIDVNSSWSDDHIGGKLAVN